MLSRRFFQILWPSQNTRTLTHMSEFYRELFMGYLFMEFKALGYGLALCLSLFLVLIHGTNSVFNLFVKIYVHLHMETYASYE